MIQTPEATFEPDIIEFTITLSTIEIEEQEEPLLELEVINTAPYFKNW